MLASVLELLVLGSGGPFVNLRHAYAGELVVA